MLACLSCSSYFCTPINNKGIANGDATSSERFRATFFDMMKRAKKIGSLETFDRFLRKHDRNIFTMESLILAQDER